MYSRTSGSLGYNFIGTINKPNTSQVEMERLREAYKTKVGNADKTD